ALLVEEACVVIRQPPSDVSLPRIPLPVPATIHEPSARAQGECRGDAAAPRDSPLRFLPDAPLVHEPDLAPDDLLAVLRVLHRRALEIEVLRVDRPVVEDLVELGPEIFQPVVPLRAGAVIPEGLDVDHAADVGRAGAVVLASDDSPLVVDDERAPAEG